MPPFNFNHAYAPLKINETRKKSSQERYIKIIKKNNEITSMIFLLAWRKSKSLEKLPKELIFEILDLKMACHAKDLVKITAQFEKMVPKVYLQKDSFGLLFDNHDNLPSEYELNPTNIMKWPCQIL